MNITAKLLKITIKDQAGPGTKPSDWGTIQATENRELLGKIINLVMDKQTTLIVVLTPLKKEIAKEVYVKERTALINHLNALRVPYINLLDKKYQLREYFFKDGIHLNRAGRKAVGDIMCDYIKEHGIIPNNSDTVH